MSIDHCCLLNIILLVYMIFPSIKYDIVGTYMTLLSINNMVYMIFPSIKYDIVHISHCCLISIKYYIVGIYDCPSIKYDIIYPYNI
jgi:hypothetical protein